MEEKRGLFHRGHIALVVALAGVLWSMRLGQTSLGDWCLAQIQIEGIQFISIRGESRKADITLLCSLGFWSPALVLAHNSDDSKCGAIAKTVCLIMLSSIFVMLLNLGAEGLYMILSR